MDPMTIFYAVFGFMWLVYIWEEYMSSRQVRLWSHNLNVSAQYILWSGVLELSTCIGVEWSQILEWQK